MMVEKMNSKPTQLIRIYTYEYEQTHTRLYFVAIYTFFHNMYQFDVSFYFPDANQAKQKSYTQNEQ